MTHMYPQYLKEYDNFDTLETDFGFIIYKIELDHIFIRDIYILPEFRNGIKGKILGDLITQVAEENGKPSLVGCVWLKSKTPELTMQYLIRWGMKFAFTDKEMMFFKKDL